MRRGIDISYFNQGINIAQVKKEYDFAILRAGFTGYGQNRPKNKDSCFEGYYADAKKVGLPVGAYWYSCANTRQTGIDEAKYMLKNCLKGKQFEYPIYIDVEESRWQAQNKTGVTDAIIGFCETLENSGYFVGVYASLDWFYNKIETSRLERYTKWVAAWQSAKPDFRYSGFDLWQNSDNGRAAGKRVDTNIAYKEFPYIIVTGGFNGYVRGDVNNDGKTTSADARKALRFAARLETPTDGEKLRADLDGDGKVSSSDARDISKIAARIE